MNSRLLIGLIILCAAAYVGAHFTGEPGYVLIACGHWTIEMTLWVALLVWFLATLALIVIVGCIQAIHHLPTRFKQWRQARHQRRLARDADIAVVSFGQGNWLKAHSHLSKVPGLPPRMAQAFAAHQMGNATQRDADLKEALILFPAARATILLAQLRWQMENGAWEAAHLTLVTLKPIAHHSTAWLTLAYQYYQKMGDYLALNELLPRIKKARILSDEAFKDLSEETILGVIRILSEEPDTAALCHYVDKLPKAYRYQSAIVQAYGEALVAHHQLALAEKVFRSALKYTYTDALVTSYAEVARGEQALRFVEGLQKKQPVSAALLLCLGQLALQCQLWGKATHYLSDSVNLGPTPKAYELLATLSEREGDVEAAAQSYQKALVLSQEYITS